MTIDYPPITLSSSCYTSPQDIPATTLPLQQSWTLVGLGLTVNSRLQTTVENTCILHFMLCHLSLLLFVSCCIFCFTLLHAYNNDYQ